MAKLKSYISVPSQIINSLSSSSLQSLLISPKKSSKSSFSRKFFSFNSYKNPRFWFLTLFLVGLFGMLKLGFNPDPLIPFMPYPCSTTNQQDSFVSNEKSHISFASNDEQNGQKDEILKGVNESQALVSKAFGDSEEETEFWKQPDGMGYTPCLDFSREYRKHSDGIVKDRRKYLLVVVSGGMNQQRNQIVDAVVIARILGAALVVPILQVNVIWGDER